jgi:hypothetical protein
VAGSCYLVLYNTVEHEISLQFTLIDKKNHSGFRDLQFTVHFLKIVK